MSSEHFIDWRNNLSASSNLRNISIINSLCLVISVVLLVLNSPNLPLAGIVILLSMAILILDLVFAIFPLVDLNLKEFMTVFGGKWNGKKRLSPEKGKMDLEAPPTSKISGSSSKKPKADPIKPLLPPKLPSKLPSKSILMGSNRRMDSINIDLGIPAIPMKKIIKIQPSDLDTKLILEEESQNPNIKVILVECQICGTPIKMPVPRKIIEESELPVTDVTYIHGDPPHAITAQLDRDFQVRRRRAAQTVFEEKVKTLMPKKSSVKKKKISTKKKTTAKKKKTTNKKSTSQ